MDKTSIDPVLLETYSKLQLVELHEQSKSAIEELEGQCKAIRDYLSELIKGNGEVIGQWAVSKVNRKKYTIELEKAEELGAVKIQKTIDAAALKKLEIKGIEIPYTMTEYLMIKPIVKEGELIK